jgi:hypothetical protein
MPVTLTASYRETLAPETVEEIDRLVDNSYALDDMLVFIDEQGQSEFRKFYEDYVEAGEQYGYDAVDIFISDITDIHDIDKFEAAYIGEYSSPARMAEDFLEHEVDRLPYFVVIDWDMTAEYLIDHDIDRHGDHYFHTYY